MAGGKATRQAFGEALARLGAEEKRIVALDADLAKSTKSEIFAKKFPDRFFEMGIQEANMIGVAAGMAFSGKLPFLCSFGCFLTGRYDTIRLSVAYANADVRLIGTHAGIGIGDDGHSQMGLEDVALMRALPTMGVFQPADAAETDRIMDYLVRTWKGPAYLRLTRQALPDLPSTPWTPLKLQRLRDPSEKAPGGPRVLLVGSGAGTAECLGAAEKLAARGVAASVWNAHCLKPFDEDGLLSAIDKEGAKLVVTVEDHSVVGGLGTCVAEALARRGARAALVKIGVQDTFGESGDPAELFEKHGLSAARVAETVARALS